MMGTYFSNAVISEVILDAVSQVLSWLHFVVVVVDKCVDSIPRGPVGSMGHGGFAEVEFTLNGTDSISFDSNQSIGAKILKSLKLVELGSKNNCGVRSTDLGDGKGDQTRGLGDGGDHACAVCLGDITEEVKVYDLPQCEHIFHSDCLDRWVSHKHYTCPLCRTSLITGSSSTAGGETMMQDEEGTVDEDYSFWGFGSFLGTR